MREKPRLVVRLWESAVHEDLFSIGRGRHMIAVGEWLSGEWQGRPPVGTIPVPVNSVVFEAASDQEHASVRSRVHE